ncbi:hypothetical protein CONPUDRAFT_154964 [Coniophora puteana RWD-64-598 SS2]|uniref:Uncharacterized protein n=1 Tax=Coniophora puteana (strain RWD-64-598) TaxID=741705 RepID=A0A5M3MKH3_CONPW|nr:uncharacterized protein CONPUDRAFT_154964 [Coniophora puteana RWD-64-598 SS2]EIW79566.1 hypothetical protein CONPUDRAFT_154964 [Coniophora puteana RWD-64-598 SS2]
MPQDSPTLIDPNLLSQGIALDPMDALMAEVNRGLAATGNGSLHIENGSQDGRPEAELEDDGFSHSISSQLSIPSSQNLPVFTSLPDSFTVESNVHFGQQVKRGVDLSPQAENAFDIFCTHPPAPPYPPVSSHAHGGG